MVSLDPSSGTGASNRTEWYAINAIESIPFSGVKKTAYVDMFHELDALR
jgi:hypothetical protein